MSTGLINPSYADGFAPRDGLPANPNLRQGLVGLWSTGLGPTGLMLRDQSGLQNVGTLTGMTPATDWIVAGHPRLGQALDLGGAGHYVAIDSTRFPTLLASESATISCWLRLADTPGGTLEAMFAFGAGGDNPLMAVTIHSGRGISGILETDTSGQIVLSTDGDKATVGQWHHVALVFDRNQNLAKRYLDGKVTGTQDNIAAQTGSVSTLGNVTIARMASIATYFHGALAEVGFWRRALVPNEIQQLYGDPLEILRLEDEPLVEVGAIMNQFQGSNLGADLYDGALL